MAFSVDAKGCFQLIITRPVIFTSAINSHYFFNNHLLSIYYVLDTLLDEARRGVGFYTQKTLEEL